MDNNTENINKGDNKMTINGMSIWDWIMSVFFNRPVTTTTTTTKIAPPVTTTTTTTTIPFTTTTTTPSQDNGSNNKPNFDPNHWPSNWSTKSERKYDGELSKMGEFRGVVRCNNEDDAMSKRYFLRSHFEWDLGRQYGAKPRQVTIVIHQKDKRCIAWAVSTEDPQNLPLPK